VLVSRAAMHGFVPFIVTSFVVIGVSKWEREEELPPLEDLLCLAHVQPMIFNEISYSLTNILPTILTFVDCFVCRFLSVVVVVP
jgi:hypothetical protein